MRSRSVVKIGVVVATTLLGFAPLARADCLVLPDARIERLDAQVGRDARSVLKTIQAELAARDALNPAKVARLAALYSVQAHAYSVLELDREAREAASKGLELVPAPTDPVHVNLLIQLTQNVYDETGLDDAVHRLETARAQQPAGSGADLCLLTTLGVVQMRRERFDLAITELTQAYRATGSPALSEQHHLAAEGLASLLRYIGDYAQALALNQEVIDWDIARQSTLDLSVARFLRARILLAMGNSGQAIEQLHLARAISVALDDQQGVAFADQAQCRVHIERGEFTVARDECGSALRTFTQSQSLDMIKSTQLLLARVDFAQDHVERARALLEAVLDRGGSDIAAHELMEAYALRAQVNASLQDYPQAYRDLNTYVERYRAANDVERGRQITALGAQLESDRAIERNATLQHELALSNERSRAQALQLRWTRIATFVGAGIIGLLSYLLIINRRYRRQLVRQANQDALTGLPNRRRTAERLAGQLREAAAAGEPLTIALLDFDHFKQINDRHGHACGDFVLREFARLSRTVLRADDTLGRWGGEEFLLILPHCKLDDAYRGVERLRKLVADIRLPGAPADTRVSISAGLATRITARISPEELVASADAALYDAKSGGRDLSRIADASLSAASTGLRRALLSVPQS
jgi:diguanylate cyclase (GGDEF)-like protein